METFIGIFSLKDMHDWEVVVVSGLFELLYILKEYGAKVTIKFARFLLNGNCLKLGLTIKCYLLW